MLISSTERDLEVCAKTIYLQAGHKSFECQLSLAHLILNRARENRAYFGGSCVADVCLSPHQFSAWNGRTPEQITPCDAAFEAIFQWLPAVLAGECADATDGALYYHTPLPGAFNPAWTLNVQPTRLVDGVQFYCERNRAACLLGDVFDGLKLDAVGPSRARIWRST